MVKEEMGAESTITILAPGMNKEYTGDNSRLLDEIGAYEFVSLRRGIQIQIESEET